MTLAGEQADWRPLYRFPPLTHWGPRSNYRHWVHCLVNLSTSTIHSQQLRDQAIAGVEIDSATLFRCHSLLCYSVADRWWRSKISCLRRPMQMVTTSKSADSDRPCRRSEFLLSTPVETWRCTPASIVKSVCHNILNTGQTYAYQSYGILQEQHSWSPWVAKLRPAGHGEFSPNFLGISVYWVQTS